MTNPNYIDPRDFNRNSQLAHVGITYSICLSFYAKFGFWGWAFSAACILVYSVWHEYFYDPVHEDAATRGSDTEDFIFLNSGPLLSLLFGHFVLHYVWF